LKTNWVREKIRAGQPSIGSFMGLGSPNVAELLAHAGFDWLVIETEHNGLDSAEIQHMLMAMSGTDAMPIVRIPSANQVFIQRALDMGAMGIVVPLVRTADEARAIVAATRYPPHGTRSFGPLRAEKYSFDREDYFNRANDNILVILILETKEAAENLDEIMSVPGVDVLYFGFMDLCLTQGLNPLKLPHPQIDAIVTRALALGKKHGVAIGTGASTPAQVRALQASGHTVIGYGPDYVMLADAARAGLAAFKREP
jgi:4-hydroxy-2-oxoheptanedioate aldolase